MKASKGDSAATSESENFRNQALRENQIQETNRSKTKEILRMDTDLQGVLRLDNPYRSPRVSKTRNTFALSFRPFKPSGFAEVEGSQKFEFKDISEFMIPTLEFSLLSRRPIDTTFFDYGVKGTAGYFAQTKRLRLEATRDEADVTFGIAAAEVGPVVQLRPASWGRWQGNAMLVYGIVQHHQNSSTSFARFAHNQGFWGLNIGPGLKVSESWFVEANYKFARSLGASAQNYLIQIPESSYSLGLSRQW